MHARFIERRAAALACAAAMGTAVLAGSCAQILGIEELSGPEDFAVSGIATGVLGPVALELRLSDGVELKSVTGNGAFAFDRKLPDGASYIVVLADPDVPCVLRHNTGVITGAHTAIELTCTGPSLASLAVSGIVPPVILLVPGTTEYAVDVPLLQQAATVAAMVTTPGDALAIAGTIVASGEPSAELPLNPGDTLVDIVVENRLGWQRTYCLTLRRAAQITQYAYAKASNTDADDRFGYGALAMSGDTLAVGAGAEDSMATGTDGDQGNSSAQNSGAVYVFRRTGTSWQQEAYLKASNTEGSDFFGSSVALSGDTLAVSAWAEDSAATGPNGNQASNGTPESGAVYVFRRTGTSWQQEAYLKASNTGANDYLGQAVALSGDTLVVAACGEDSGATGPNGNQADEGAPDSGAAYVFRRTGTSWQQEAYLKASNTSAGDCLRLVALSDDTLALGAWLEDSAATGTDGNQADESAPDSGAVYVFRRTGTSWKQEAYLKASNTGAGDVFGDSVALSGDVLAVGAVGEDSAATGTDGNQADESAPDSGAVYVVRRTEAGWQQEAYLKASNTGAGDRFGRSVALSGDTLVVGAEGEASAAKGTNGNQSDDSAPESGAVYVFRRTGPSWQQDAYVKASNTGGSDWFGVGLALSSDTLAVGAWGEASAATGVNGDQASNTAPQSGAVYIFH